MKKLIALLLVLTMAIGFAACGSKEEAPMEEITVETEVVTDETEETTEETTEEETPAEDITVDEMGDETLDDILDNDMSVELPIMTPDGEFIEVEDFINSDAPEAAATETLTVLNNIWALYGEGDKFAIMGGNPEAGIMDAPGVYDMAYAENLGYNLVIPAEQIANVTEAATMIHMMNANTFTCGALKLAEGVDAAAFAAAVRDAIQGNQWICGFPEKLIVADLGNGCVLVSFGMADAMGTFEAKLTEAYAGAQILYNEAIAG
ncbi:MAG: hypothetical protein J6J43_04345 [Oscillospiraceae bacterium]|nr:hypothetical protein [Oscillospiraceae bacterium]